MIEIVYDLVQSKLEIDEQDGKWDQEPTSTQPVAINRWSMLILIPCGQSPGIGSNRLKARRRRRFLLLSNWAKRSWLLDDSRTSHRSRKASLSSPSYCRILRYISPSVGFFWFAYSSTREVFSSSPMSKVLSVFTRRSNQSYMTHCVRIAPRESNSDRNF